MRLIDADALIGALHNHTFLEGDDRSICYNVIHKQPTIESEIMDDLISRQKVRYKLTALVNELEEIFADIVERNENDAICGLCEYDGAYIGQSGEWCNKCPGFDKADCFKLKDKIREEWVAIDE